MRISYSFPFPVPSPSLFLCLFYPTNRRFGLIDGEFKTVAQVAHVAQTSRKEVRKIESKAMQLLRDPLKQRRLKEFFKTSRSPLVEELLSEGIALYDE